MKSASLWATAIISSSTHQSNAGGFGVLGAVGFSPEQLATELEWIDAHVGDKPYGVDIVIPGKYEGMGEMDPA